MLWLSWSGHSLGMLTNNTLDFSAFESRMQPSRKPTSPWSFYYFFFMVDCQMLHFYFLFFTVTYKSQIIAPQGDALQQGTEVSGYVVLP
jgi:hypothetical protein